MNQTDRPIESRTNLRYSLERLVDKEITWSDINIINREDILEDLVEAKDIILLKYLFPAHVKNMNEGYRGKDLLTRVKEAEWNEAVEYLKTNVKDI